MSATKLNPILEGMIIGLIATLSEQGAEFLFQKMVDKNKGHATTVLQTLNQAITDVAATNGIDL